MFQDILTAVYVTVAPPDAPRDGAAQMALAIDRLPSSRAKKLRFLLRLLGFSGFAGRDQEGRTRYLRAMSHSPIPDLRTGYAALVRLALFIAYAGDDDGARNRTWERIGYPGPRDDVPPIPISIRGSELPASFDAIVIGSGAGGGVAAAVLADAGMRVVIFEAGPWPDEVAHGQRERDAFAELYLESGLCASEDLGVSILAGACVGGGTAVNWSTSLRLGEAVAAQWERATGGIDFGASLRSHYDAISQRLALQPTTDHNANNAALLRGAQALGWSCSAQPRNAACQGDGCGYCPFGCAYGTKGSTDRTFVPDLLAAGGSVSANSPVERILVENGRAAGVCARVDGDLRTFRAPLVVCAAGALRTPQLLAGAGVRSPHLGAHLHLHPTTGVFAEFSEPIQTWLGPAQSVLSDEFAELDDAYGVVLEVAPAHPGLAALSMPWLGRGAHAEMMGRSRNAAALIAIVRDRGQGHVTTGAYPRVRYKLDPYDAEHLRGGIARLCELAIAAGARRVATLHNEALILEASQGAESAAFQRDLARASLRANRVGIFSAHQMGTARMSQRRDDGVVDPSGRVYAIEGLLVADASVFPLASGVNPMLTIMALAHRTATRALALRPLPRAQP